MNRAEHLDEAVGPADLPVDFAERLETLLHGADQERRRRIAIRRAKIGFALLLLLGPVLAWRLMLASPDGVHVGIAALAWIAFILDACVHVDTALLAYLGLQALPSVVGVLLLILVIGGLLGTPRGKDR